MSIRLLSAFLLALFAASPAPAETTTTALFTETEPGGSPSPPLRNWTLTDASVSATISADQSYVDIQFQSRTSSTAWTRMRFKAPQGLVLSPGTYEQAQRHPFQPNVLPGLDVSADHSGCNTLSGRFIIYDLTADSTGRLTSFAADFEQHCSDQRPAMFGAVRINSARASLTPFDGAYPSYSLTVQPAVNGYVNATGIDCGAGRTDCAETFGAVTSVTLTATPSPGFIFLGWAGDCIGNTTAVLSVDRPTLCIPVFNSAGGTGVDDPSYAVGSVFLDRQPLSTGARTMSVYPPALTEITVSSFNEEIWVRFEAYRNKSGFIRFAPPVGGTLQVGDYLFARDTSSSRGNSPGLDVDGCGEGGRYRIYELTRSEGAVTSFAADFEATCTSGGTLTAATRYQSNRSTLLPYDGVYPLYLLRAQSSVGGGVSATGIDCGAGSTDCEEIFTTPATVAVTAVPDAGYEFLGWSDACSGNSMSASVVVDRPRRCIAYFQPTVGSAAPADPAYASKMLWRNQPGATSGQRRALTDADSTFSISASGTRAITVNVANPQGSASVTFGAPSLPLTALSAGTYYREAYSSPNDRFPTLQVSGCSVAVGRFRIYQLTFGTTGQVLTLAADFEAQCFGAAGPVYGAVRYNSSRASVRPFDGGFPEYSLAITPAINGTVTGSGIACGPGQTDCAETYATPDTVQLTATPASGFAFIGWRGWCDGAATTSLVVTFPMRCAAVFNSVPAGSSAEDPAIAEGSLFIDSDPGDPVGQGRRHVWTDDVVIRPSVWSRSQIRFSVREPNGRQWDLEFTAPGDLTPRVYEGAISPSSSSGYPGFRISGWSYCSSPTSTFQIHELTLAAPAFAGGTPVLTAFAADFVQHCNDALPALRGAIRYGSSRSTLTPFDGRPPSYTLHVMRPSNGAVVTTGVACGGSNHDCAEEFSGPTTVTLRAIADPGYMFSGWTGACSGSGSTVVLNIQIAKYCSATFVASTLSRLRASVYVSGLVEPVAMAVDPADDGRLFIAQRDGRIRLSNYGSLLSTDFLDLRSIVSTNGVEGGILGLAFPFDYAATGRFFVSYTNAAGNIVVSRFRRSATNANVADPSLRYDLVWSNALRYIPHPFNNGHAAAMAFGADGFLYIALSDGGGGDPYHLAQSGNNLLGKILRIDINVGDWDLEGFDVPADNPFLADARVSPEVWAYGLRRPRQITFDPLSRGGTGAMVVVDRGATRWEEINYEPAGAGGRNYGWRNFEGAHALGAPEPLAFGPPTTPLFEYDHSVGTAITGGVVYRTTSSWSFTDQYAGRYFFADYAAGRVWSLAISPNVATGEAIAGDLREHTTDLGVTGGLGTISAMTATAWGDIYILSQSSGRVIRVSSAFSSMPTWTAPPAADINDDARLDLIWHHATQGYVAAWLLNGTTLIDSVLTNPGSVSDTNWKIVATPRLNPDFKTDLVWQDDREGWLGAWIMNGRHLLESVSLTPSRVADTDWKIVGSADLNRDGKMDLIWRHVRDGWIAAWLMDGTIMIESVLLSPDRVTDVNWKIVGSGDFNRDGHADLLWWNAEDGWLVAWDMVGTQMVGSVSLIPERVADVSWVPVSVADVNVDGTSDLIWQHRTEGWLAVWLMNGRTLLSSVSLSPERVADVNWRIVGPR